MKRSKQDKTGKKQAKKSWHGRLEGAPDEQTSELLSSLDVDVALWKYDIAGSIAHARMLSSEGLISEEEFSKIRKGLEEISKEIESGDLELKTELEDIHMVIESALIEKVGSIGGKLHAGRSRNDQVALDLKLWARDTAKALIEKLRDLQKQFVALADKSGKILFPAYTHLQPAQPIAAGHLIMSYVEMLDRDTGRLEDMLKRLDFCPLGSGAVAGTSLPLNREMTAGLTGFSDITRNSIDATSDRDFLVELCFACSMLGVHLSRWCEDWIIYSSREFRLVELDDAYCTSSSMMPQKKNADTLELIRGKSASAIADLVGLLTLMKSLPSGYSRDMQDDKRFVFRTTGAMLKILGVAAGVVSTTRLLEPDLNDGFLDATSLAEYLATLGIPFRQAHGIVGKIVVHAEKKNLALGDIPKEEMEKLCGVPCPDMDKYLGAANVIASYSPPGSGGMVQLDLQLEYWKNKLSM